MIIVINFSAVFVFNTFAVFFLRVNLPELTFYRWRVRFQKYFCPLWQGLSYGCAQCMTRTCSDGCSYRCLMSFSLHVVCPSVLSQQNSLVKNGHRICDIVVALCCQPSITLGCKFQLLPSTEVL